MSNLAIVYHSAHGHTEFIARQVLVGTRQAEDIARTPDHLIGYDGLVLGSPTYLGGVSGPFRSFMDSTGRLWRTQQLKGKLDRAVGFSDSFAGLWTSAWLTAWLVAFPVVLVVAPLARRTVALLVDVRP